MHTTHRSGRGLTAPSVSKPTSRSVLARNMRDVDTDRRPTIPAAPPLRESYPPPPPPPTNPTSEGGDWRPSRRSLGLILLAGGLGMYGLQKTILDEAPRILRSEDGGYFVKTAKGNTLRIFSDKEGRLWFLDKSGNFFYDTDIPGGGFYAYTRDGAIYNLYEDNAGNPRSKYVGTIKVRRCHTEPFSTFLLFTSQLNILSREILLRSTTRCKQDLRVVNSQELGPFIAFEDGRQLPLPPGAVTYRVNKDNNTYETVLPPLIEEGYIRLEKRGNLLEKLLPQSSKGPLTFDDLQRGEPL